METKIVEVKKLQPGNILADSVVSCSGKVLLGKNIVLTAKHISLLITWDIQNVFIQTDELQAEAVPSPEVIEPQQSPFEQKYQTLVTDMHQILDIIKRRNRIPVISLQNTANTIHSFIMDNGSTAINYLLASNFKLTDYITQHSIAVAFFAGIISHQLHWNEEDIKGVTLAGLLHDVGNWVANGKADGPSDHFYVAETASLLKKATGLTNGIILGILQHRQCVDESDLLTTANSHEIHPYAKVIAACDIFINQTYTADSVNPFPALHTLASEMFGKLDPSVCHTFISRVQDSLLHSKILLSDGQEAEIIFFHPNGSHLPIVRTSDDQIIDMGVHTDRTIQRIAGDALPIL